MGIDSKFANLSEEYEWKNPDSATDPVSYIFVTLMAYLQG